MCCPIPPLHVLACRAPVETLSLPPFGVRTVVEGVINSCVAIQPCYEKLYCCVCGNFYPAEGYV